MQARLPFLGKKISILHSISCKDDAFYLTKRFIKRYRMIIYRKRLCELIQVTKKNVARNITKEYLVTYLFDREIDYLICVANTNHH